MADIEAKLEVYADVYPEQSAIFTEAAAEIRRLRQEIGRKDSELAKTSDHLRARERLDYVRGAISSMKNPHTQHMWALQSDLRSGTKTDAYKEGIDDAVARVEEALSLD